jgi:hypothetical protein
VDLWITDAALSGDFEKRQVRLGPREIAENRPHTSLKELFPQVVGAAFQMMEARADYWLSRSTCDDIPSVDGLPRVPAPAPTSSPTGTALLESFAGDVRNLGEILTKILTPATMHGLATASGAAEGHRRYPADLWAATVGEFLLAYHHGVMRRDHVIQALLPLYTARVGSFLEEQAHADQPAIDAALESLCERFEQIKGLLVDRWRKEA